MRSSLQIQFYKAGAARPALMSSDSIEIAEAQAKKVMLRKGYDMCRIVNDSGSGAEVRSLRLVDNAFVGDRERQ